MRRMYVHIFKSVMVVAMLLGLVSGVTYAALQSNQVTLKGSTIQTATASLQVSTDGTTYATSVPGFSFAGLVPGGPNVPSPGYPLYLKNVGTTPLSIRISLAKPPTNADTANLLKVHLVLTSPAGTVQTIALSDLNTAATTGGIQMTFVARLAPGQVQSLTVQTAMDTDAVTGSGATISDVDVSFSGVSVN